MLQIRCVGARKHFGGTRKVARQAYRDFVAAGMKLGHQDKFYFVDEGRILGSEEFVDATIHRIGETKRSPGVDKQGSRNGMVEVERLVAAVEAVCGIPRKDFCGLGKSARAVMAKELLIMTGRQLGASARLLSEVTGLSSGSVSRRYDAARSKVRKLEEMNKLMVRINREYLKDGE